jgi:hypothetical protein
VFSIGQRTAVVGAFKLAGYDRPLTTLPVECEDERIFVLSQDDLARLHDVRTLEQIVQKLLGRKVAIIGEHPGLPAAVPFE